MQRAGMVRFAVAAGVVWVAACGAQGGQQGQPRMVLQVLDTDGNGTLSAGEIQAAPRTLLLLDRNGDGQLTADELQPRPGNAGTADELVKQMMSFDRNGDGVLTADELPARMQPMFARGDTNGDGKLTPEEIRAMAERQRMPAGTRIEPGHAGGAMRLDPLLNALDANHDGVISAEEIAGAAKALLVLDANGDGQISPDEMRVRQQTPAERVDHLLDEWDTDKDGRISKAEAPEKMQGQFVAIDTNGDGYLDRQELLVYFTALGSSTAQGGQRKETH